MSDDIIVVCPVMWAGYTRTTVDGRSIFACGACCDAGACADAGECERLTALPAEQRAQATHVPWR